LEVSWDYDGDRRRDLLRLQRLAYVSGGVALHPNLAAAGLGQSQPVHPTIVADGVAVPLDPNADGELDLIVSRLLDSKSTDGPNELVLLRRDPSAAWVDVGTPISFDAGCGWMFSYAYGDFDDDGDTDVAVLDVGTGCDPFPPAYDPSWYRVGVLVADGITGEITLGGWFPTGAIPAGDRIWSQDLDADEALDLVVLASRDQDDGGGWAVTWLRGRGDGTFDDGVFRELDSPLPTNHRLHGRGDFDGDGVDEWIANAAGGPWILPGDLSPGPQIRYAV